MAKYIHVCPCYHSLKLKLNNASWVYILTKSCLSQIETQHNNITKHWDLKLTFNKTMDSYKKHQLPQQEEKTRS